MNNVKVFVLMAGLTGLLVALGGQPANVAAGVVLYSTFTVLLEIPVGTAITAAWWARPARLAVRAP